MNLTRTPLRLVESDLRRRERERALEMGAEDKRSREALAREQERSSDLEGSRRTRHRDEIHAYIEAVKKKNDLHARMREISHVRRNDALQRGQAGARKSAASEEQKRELEEATKAKGEARLKLLVQLAHPHSATMRAREARRLSAHTIDRSFFPKGEEGDNAHHAVLADLHDHEPEPPRQKWRRVRATGTGQNDHRYIVQRGIFMRQGKNDDFHDALKHHGYEETHNIKSGDMFNWVGVDRKNEENHNEPDTNTPAVGNGF